MEQTLKQALTEIIPGLYGPDIDLSGLDFIPTKKEFEGDITLPVFPLVKQLRRNPKEIAEEIGRALKEKVPQIAAFNVVGGFLNLFYSDDFFIEAVKEHFQNEQYGIRQPRPDKKKLMVEYSSPNTNKPLHLGHIRNNLLGYSVSKIYEATGKPVIKTQIINDRGIHICKSMLAWQKFGNGETPESSGVKGDHLVGKYYVIFDKEYKKQINGLINKGVSEEEATTNAPLMIEAREMLRKWEAKDPEVRELWRKMNGWVLEGFKQTYAELGVDFDVEYFESDTYLLGKKIVEEGLRKGIFYREEDGSVWVDLTDQGLDKKLLLRSDGTSVYITQDLGTAVKRFNDFDIDQLIYVVGNEQDYHFKVLFAILKKLGYPWAAKLYHLSYGMVELPHGKMKSREGTVVDADDLLEEMTQTAKKISEELGKLEGFDEKEKERLYKIIGQAALKYYILKVDPKKGIMFDPEKSVDFNGNTGPFLQYAYVRIKSILRKAGKIGEFSNAKPGKYERELIKKLLRFEQIIRQAASDMNPAVIAHYIYDVAKAYNAFYQNVPILQAPEEERNFRLALSALTANIIKNGLNLLGIEVPERM